MNYIHKIFLYVFYISLLLLLSCKGVTQDFTCKNFRKAIIEDQYDLNYVFTIRANYNGEHLRILTDRFRLIHLLEESGEVIDSLIINDGVLLLNDSTFKKVQVLKPQNNIDTIISKGKKKTLATYFDEDGLQKKF